MGREHLHDNYLHRCRESAQNINLVHHAFTIKNCVRYEIKKHITKGIVNHFSIANYLVIPARIGFVERIGAQAKAKRT